MKYELLSEATNQLKLIDFLMDMFNRGDDNYTKLQFAFPELSARARAMIEQYIQDVITYMDDFEYSPPTAKQIAEFLATTTETGKVTDTKPAYVFNKARYV